MCAGEEKAERGLLLPYAFARPSFRVLRDSGWWATGGEGGMRAYGGLRILTRVLHMPSWGSAGLMVSLMDCHRWRGNVGRGVV